MEVKQVMATINTIKLHEERQKRPKSFLTSSQVCEQLLLNIGQSEQATKALFKSDSVTSLTEQLKRLLRPLWRSTK